MKALLLVLCLATGCLHVDRAALLASTATLACDWNQTRQASKLYAGQSWEANPFLGPSPSTRTVNYYMASTMLLNLVLYSAIPERYSWIIPTAVTGFEVQTIAHNQDGNVPGVCGVK